MRPGTMRPGTKRQSAKAEGQYTLKVNPHEMRKNAVCVKTRGQAARRLRRM